MKTIQDIYLDEVHEVHVTLGEKAAKLFMAEPVKKFVLNCLLKNEQLHKHDVMQGQRVLIWLGQWRDKLPIEAVHALQDIVSCPTVGKAGEDASVSDGK